MGYPNFLCIGAQKAGTTWVHVCLSRHPDVFLPPHKEIHYFNALHDFNRQKFITTLNRTRTRIKQALAARDGARLYWYAKYLFMYPKDDTWYRSLFPENGYKIIGEFTPAYSTLPRARIKHVRTLLPDAKILFIMRNPVDRVWSAVRWRYGGKEARDLNQVSIDDMLDHINNRKSVRQTSYVQTMENWEHFFPRKQILYKYYDQILKDPEEFLRSICEFLSVKYDKSYFEAELMQKRNVSNKLEMPQEVREHVRKMYEGLIDEMIEKGHDIPQEWLDSFKSASY